MVDNGCGFDVSNVRKNRLGLSIVQTLVKDKLRGSLEIVSGPQELRLHLILKNSIIDSADAMK